MPFLARVCLAFVATIHPYLASIRHDSSSLYILQNGSGTSSEILDEKQESPLDGALLVRRLSRAFSPLHARLPQCRLRLPDESLAVSCGNRLQEVGQERGMS